jgi:nitric oxide reductase NorE protein
MSATREALTITHGSTPRAAASPAGARTRHLPGEVGTWVFILGDMTVFALLFGVYVYYRNKQPELFRHSQLTLHRSFGGINTLLLLTSSLCVVVGVRAARLRAASLPTIAFAAALVCGLGFIVNKYLEWSDLLSHGFKPATNNFYMYFFVLTGLHLFHLLLGMAMLVGLIVLARRQTGKAIAFIEGGGCFWHMVDLLWIVLFALLYLMH